MESSTSGAILLAVPQVDIALCILSACSSWREVGCLLQLNRAWSSEVRSAAWKLFVDLLEERSQLFVPPPFEGRERTPEEWQKLFFQLLPCAHVWTAAPVDGLPLAGEKVLMRVCARFRPRTRDRAAGLEREAAETRVVLPLHQRLQLIKASHACSSYEAQRLLWANADGANLENDPFAAPMGDSEVRALLPLGDATNLKELSAQGSCAAEGAAEDELLEGAALGSLQLHQPTTKAGVVAVDASTVVFCAPTIGLREFRFSAAFSQSASQASVYEASLRPLLVDVLNGRSGCVLCFGQTGSGKTFTVSGPNEAAATGLGQGGASASARQQALDPSAGLLPRALRELLDAQLARQAGGRFEVELRLSAVEIYGDEVTDLLRQGAALGAWRGVAARALAEGLADVVLESPEQCSALLLAAERAKRRAATAMNERSSRAHAIVTVSVSQQDSEGRQMRSMLCVADLGGSEQLKRSKAVGDRMLEAVRINLGLLALKSCVSALTQGASHVPYHNSKLTQLLQPGLSGRAQTVVVVCASPEPEDAAETMEALRFGELCAVLESSAKMPTASLMAQTLRTLDSEIARVEALIKAKERWEVVTVHRADERALADQSGLDHARQTERLVTTKLVGAEAEREELEELLARRRELVGDVDAGEVAVPAV